MPSFQTEPMIQIISFGTKPSVVQLPALRAIVPPPEEPELVKVRVGFPAMETSGLSETSGGSVTCEAVIVTFVSTSFATTVVLDAVSSVRVTGVVKVIVAPLTLATVNVPLFD